ncbi:unnamed protein product (macronuclear) [Paramecium tetraurelia]|uniref:Oxysterol-binding protein n=1 Tax=Paramecium tetraurelia TaxID=5888 RepID=A0CNY9_PARTE|nr:uncharacterized protein GSPATT00038775001 [Paramecium tetraurelia]CAK72506.1 unnamed protein product [Paramecium tetraurelia]|eukprot:XP_001439903.1 hypothetical protein (macronuclear) [Paramecium tetraurelia strain d4-2]
MICCSSSKKKDDNKKPIEILEQIAPENQQGDKSCRTNQQQEVELEMEERPKKNSVGYQVQDENVSASICPSFVVGKTPFTLFVMSLLEKQQNMKKESQQQEEMKIDFQEDLSVIVSYPQIEAEVKNNEKDKSQLVDIPDQPEMTIERCSEEEAKNAAIFKWAKEIHDYNTDNTEELISKAVSNFKPLQSKEESRSTLAHKDGGKVCKNKKLIRTLRAIGKELIKQIGKHNFIWKFKFNNSLEKVLMSSCLFPLYINRAVLEKDPIERMKLIICATLGNFYLNCSFLKPLNPILGETISGLYQDGTTAYAEQISHHPSHYYKFYGYYNYEAKAGVNSLSLRNKGKRFLQFADGELIEYNFAGEEYSGSFWGPMKVECKGKITFLDKKNDISACVELDSVRWKASDYLSGEIKQKGKKVCKIYGSYMGYIEFGEVRYWDVNYIRPYECKVFKPNQFLLSDASFRPDLRQLKRNKVQEAQKEKDDLEMQQRQDAKLRKPKK